MLKLFGSDEYCRGVKPIMAKPPPVKVEDWPGVKAGAGSKSVPRSRKWGKAKLLNVGEGGAQGQEDDEEAHEQKLDAPGHDSPNAEG